MKRAIQVGGECAISRLGYEDNWHCFVTCPFAVGCWRLETIFINIVDSCDSFSEVIFKITNYGDESEKEKMVMLIWQIWKERNEAVWRQNHRVPDQTAAQACVHLREWKEAHAGTGIARARISASCRGWHDLQPGWFKCNIDAAFFHNPHATGMGMILRDEGGNFISTRMACILGCLRVEEGEAMGLNEAMSWIKDLGYTRVIFETDSKIVVDVFATRLTDASEFGEVIRSCKQILEDRCSFKICHIKREVNYLAHALARNSRNSYIPYELPNIVATLQNNQNKCN